MKNARVAIAAMLLLSTITVLAVPPSIIPKAHAQQSLQLFLFTPRTASPGETVAVELWTIFENTTSGRPDLAFNATGTGTCGVSLFPCLSFLVKINLGISAPPHVHTPSGSFVALAAFKSWVHLGAWNTSYTVPSQLGLYGVHLYANYTIRTGPNAFTSFVSQAETTFSVQTAPATPADLTSNVSSLQNIVYGVLGLVVLAVILDVLLLFWKKSPVKPQ